MDALPGEFFDGLPASLVEPDCELQEDTAKRPDVISACHCAAKGELGRLICFRGAFLSGHTGGYVGTRLLAVELGRSKVRQDEVIVFLRVPAVPKDVFRFDIGVAAKLFVFIGVFGSRRVDGQMAKGRNYLFIVVRFTVTDSGHFTRPKTQAEGLGLFVAPGIVKSAQPESQPVALLEEPSDVVWICWITLGLLPVVLEGAFSPGEQKVALIAMHECQLEAQEVIWTFLALAVNQSLENLNLVSEWLFPLLFELFKRKDRFVRHRAAMTLEGQATVSVLSPIEIRQKDGRTRMDPTP